MLILMNALLLFSIAFLIHLFIWQWYLPKNHTKGLFIIFSGVWFAGFLIYYHLHILGLFENLQLALLFISMMLVYLTTYSGVEVESPSLRIVLEIDKAGPQGLSREDLDKFFTEETLIGLRIKDLLKDGMVHLADFKYKITPKGIYLVRLFMLYRRWLNAGKGG